MLLFGCLYVKNCYVFFLSGYHTRLVPWCRSNSVETLLLLYNITFIEIHLTVCSCLLFAACGNISPNISRGMSTVRVESLSFPWYLQPNSDPNHTIAVMH